MVPDTDEFLDAIEQLLACLLGQERTDKVMAALKSTAPPADQPEEGAGTKLSMIEWAFFELERDGRFDDFPYWLRPQIITTMIQFFTAFSDEFRWEFENESGHVENRESSSPNLSYTDVKHWKLWDGYCPVRIVMRPEDISTAVEEYWDGNKRQFPQGEVIDACDKRALLLRLESWRNAVEAAIARARDMPVTEGSA